jgi:hypothetical protein
VNRAEADGLRDLCTPSSSEMLLAALAEGHLETSDRRPTSVRAYTTSTWPATASTTPYWP